MHNHSHHEGHSHEHQHFHGHSHGHGGAVQSFLEEYDAVLKGLVALGGIYLLFIIEHCLRMFKHYNKQRVCSDNSCLLKRGANIFRGGGGHTTEFLKQLANVKLLVIIIELLVIIIVIIIVCLTLQPAHGDPRNVGQMSRGGLPLPPSSAWQP